MLESRWIRWVGPGVIALGALGSVATATRGAAPAQWTPPPCGVDSGGPTAAAQSAEPVVLPDLHAEPWYRIDPRLDRDGALLGQRVALGVDGDRASRFLDLPPESFAAGPFGRLVVVGSDDGSVSRLAAIDIAGGCAFALAEEPAVIRRATIDPAGQTVYEMRVDRATRADLGIWSRPLDGSGPAVQVLEPIAADDRFGPTYTTELTWELGGRRLAVQSCGEAACRIRVIDPAGPRSRTLAETDLGTLVALAGNELVVYEACPGLPCPILGIDIRTGRRQTLADAAAGSLVIGTPDGPRLVHEVLESSGVGLRSVALDGSSSRDLGSMADGLRLQAIPAIADAATRVPAAWVLVTPDGRLSTGGPEARTQLRHIPDGTAIQLEEASR